MNIAWESELKEAAHKLVTELLRLKQGETVLIYGDENTDMRILEFATREARKAGASPILMVYDDLPELGMEPPKPVAAALKNCDVAVEFASKFLYITRAYEEAIKAGMRHLCLAGMDADMMIRCIGKVNTFHLQKFGEQLTNMTREAKRMKITTRLGTNLEYEMGNRSVYLDAGICDTPGTDAFLGGQISWIPVEKSINGTVILDGSVGPPDELGKLSSPIELTIEKGKIIDIKGKREAQIYSKWLASLDDENMYNVAHVCYGFNPMARLTGNILEDERIFGCIQFGFGSQGTSSEGEAGYARSHSDGIVLNPSIYLDDEQIEKDGEYIHPKLKFLADKLMKE